MSNTIIADSSGIISLVSNTDRNHQSAMAYVTQCMDQHGTIIVPSDVFSETINILGKKVSTQVAIRTGETLLRSETFALVGCDEDLWTDAFDRFKGQPPSVSFTDCMVMAFADYYAQKDIFGFDEVFGKNGYLTPKAA